MGGGEAGDEDTVAGIADELCSRVLERFAERPDAVREAREFVGEALTRATPAEASSALLHYVNHTALFREMDGHWQACRAAGTVTSVFLSGVRGVGKRSTALQWIHSHRDALVGVFLQADLGMRGGRMADPAVVLERWLDELGVPRDERPVEVTAKALRVRHELRDRSVVFLLENVTTTRQVRELLPLQPYGLVLLTGQEAPHDLVSFLDFLPLPVPVLRDEHALELLVRVSRTTEDPAKLEPIVRHLGGLPLALRLIAGHLRAPVPGVVEDIGVRLADRAARQELVDVDDPNPLPAALGLAYRRMAVRTAQLYRRLGVLMPEDFQLDTVPRVRSERQRQPVSVCHLSTPAFPHTAVTPSRRQGNRSHHSPAPDPDPLTAGFRGRTPGTRGAGGRRSGRARPGRCAAALPWCYRPIMLGAED